MLVGYVANGPLKAEEDLIKVAKGFGVKLTMFQVVEEL
jgi:hypothetical protein